MYISMTRPVAIARAGKKLTIVCLDYIKAYNGTNESYFEDYKGGTVSIYCNETEEDVYTEVIK